MAACLKDKLAKIQALCDQHEMRECAVVNPDAEISIEDGSKMRIGRNWYQFKHGKPS